MSGPYASPHAPQGRPAVITWYRLYAVTMPLVYVLALVVWQLVLAPRAASGGDVLVPAIGFIALIGAFFAVAALVPYEPWGHTMGTVALCVGLTTPVAPFAAVLLVYWFRPLTRAAFGRL